MRLMIIASLLLFSAVGEAQDFCRFGRSSNKPSFTLSGPRDNALRRKNARIKLEGLEIIATERRLEQLQKQGYLVPLIETAYLKLHRDFKRPERKRYRWIRPNTLTFVDDLAAMFYDSFAKPLRITSAVRTVPYQKKISGGNVNAAPTSGERASPHLTGAAVDITTVGLSTEELHFLQVVLIEWEERGFIEATEENKAQHCFDIMVFSTYPARNLTRTPEIIVASAPQ